MRGHSFAVEAIAVGGDTREDRCFPFALFRRDDLGIERRFVRLDGGVEVVEHLLLRRRREQQHRNGVATTAVEAELGDAIEEREELVELLVADRIEFVRMAPRAPHRQPHERGGRRFDAIHHVLDLILVGDGTAFEVDHVVAVEPGGDLLRPRRVREEIAGKLLDDELVVGQIAIEGVDDPVAPRPHAALAVDVIAVRVRVAGRVEPRHRHALSVVRRLQQRVDALLVRIG